MSIAADRYAHNALMATVARPTGTARQGYASLPEVLSGCASVAQMVLKMEANLTLIVGVAVPKAARLIAHVLTTLTVLSATASSVRVVSDARRRLRQSSAATESKIRARQVSTVAVQAAEQLINCVLREWRATVMLTVRPVFAFLTRQPIRKTTRTHLVPVSPVQTRGQMETKQTSIAVAEPVASAHTPPQHHQMQRNSVNPMATVQARCVTSQVLTSPEHA